MAAGRTNTDPGGGYSRSTFSLMYLWQMRQWGWNHWSIPTTGFNVVRFKWCKLKFYPTDENDYIIHWTTDFADTNAYAESEYHPAIMLLKPRHRIVQSVYRQGKTRPVKVKIHPPSMYGNDWFFMKKFARDAMFNIAVTLFDSDKPFMKKGEVKGPIDLSKDSDWVTKPDGISSNAAYWWLWDTGDGNGIQFADSKPETYDNALAKGVQYWKSLWGKVQITNVWIRVPTTGYQSTNQTNWSWGRPQPQLLRAIVGSGPFVERDLDGTVSINMKYTFKFQFGGPDNTYGTHAGERPDQIPPANAPYSEQFGLETDDLDGHVQGELMPWDIRRGIITPRGLERLTAGLSSPTEHQRRSPFAESAPLPCEEEGSDRESESSLTSEDEEEEEEINPELVEHQLELIRHLRLMEQDPLTHRGAHRAKAASGHRTHR